MAAELPGEDMDEKLRRFEKMVDVDDPEQMELLKRMQDHTKNLHRIRGDWDKPSTKGDWNPVPTGMGSKPPLELPDYRAYKEHTQREAASRQGKGGCELPLALGGGGREG